MIKKITKKLSVMLGKSEAVLTVSKVYFGNPSTEEK